MPSNENVEQCSEVESISEQISPAQGEVADAIKTRVAFQDRPATQLMIVVILLWYLVQLGALLSGWNKEALQWMFTTESFPELSPGLVLAIISHSFFDLSHIFSNTVLLWLVGGESEQHMSTSEYILFFTLTAVAAVLTGTAVSGTNTLGASGGVLAFLGFYSVHMILQHNNVFEFDTLGTKGLLTTSPRAYIGLFLILTPFTFILYMVGQILGFLPSGNADIVGHLTGFLLGISYAGAGKLFNHLC